MKRLFLLVCIISIFSCVKENAPSRESLIEQEINIKTQVYLKQRFDKCQEEYLQKIEYEVDSMMYFLVKKIKGEDDAMPFRPQRPERLVDTIKLENFLDNK